MLCGRHNAGVRGPLASTKGRDCAEKHSAAAFIHARRGEIGARRKWSLPFRIESKSLTVRARISPPGGEREWAGRSSLMNAPFSERPGARVNAFSVFPRLSLASRLDSTRLGPARVRRD